MREVLKLWWVWYFSGMLIAAFGYYLVHAGWEMGWIFTGASLTMFYRAGRLKEESRVVALLSELRRET